MRINGVYGYTPVDVTADRRIKYNGINNPMVDTVYFS